ncbi:FAD binding domain-containing protein [Pilobolus umbonatus]|nr:FAD binding domain-containing protein [Pilobolus umbonatus]
MSSDLVYDVIVSGAGPVGLFFTYIMGKHGHSVYCLDPKSGPTDQSRALMMTSRTMEILERHSIADDIVEESNTLNGVRIFHKGSLINEVDSFGDTPFPHGTILTQARTEHILKKGVETETSIKIHWECELVSYEEDEHGVLSKVYDHNEKKEKVIRSKYIVGADGCHSTVRKCNPQWTYKGISIATNFFLADITLKEDHLERFMDKMNTFTLSNYIMGIAPIQFPQKGESSAVIFRVFGNLESYAVKETVERGGDFTHGLVKSNTAPDMEFVQGWINRIASPQSFEVESILWSSYFKVNERIANGFRKNRAFLIGDSAHCHSPTGGQGLNLGLQDADNLAWKLSHVLKKYVIAHERLLDSFNTEREIHAKNTIKQTGTATKAAMAEGTIISHIRIIVMTIILAIPYIRQTTFSAMMQQKLTLHSDIMGTSDTPLIKEGVFIPESAPLRRKIIKRMGRSQMERIPIREILKRTDQYTLILLCTGHPRNRPNTEMIQHFWKSRRSYPMKKVIVESSWHSRTNRCPLFVDDNEIEMATDSFYIEENMEVSDSITKRVGLFPLLSKYFKDSNPPSALVIVRPDLYVAQASIIRSVSDIETSLFLMDSLYQ